MKSSWRSNAARTILDRTGQSEMSSAVAAIVTDLLPGHASPPTDLYSVGERLGVKITAADVVGSGELRKTGGGLEVVFSSEQPRTRQRFTIAHELGHVILQKIHPAVNQFAKETERLCDLLAVELLMPRDVFLNLPKAITLEHVQKLAVQHQTSLIATARRCAELSGATVMVFSGSKLDQISGSYRNSIGWKDDQIVGLAQNACDGETGTTQLFITHDHSVTNWTVHYRPLGKSGRAILLFTRTALPPPR